MLKVAHSTNMGQLTLSSKQANFKKRQTAVSITEDGRFIFYVPKPNYSVVAVGSFSATRSTVIVQSTISAATKANAAKNGAMTMP